jgi:hypothetical protein
MSRVYTKIKFDIETWKVLEEDSYEYDGLWSYCDSTSADSTSVSSSSLSSSSSSESSSSSSSSSSSYSSCLIDIDDDFTGTNGDSANIQKWMAVQGVDKATIQSNKYHWETASGSGVEYTRARSRWYFCVGHSFDIQVDWDYTEMTGGSTWTGPYLKLGFVKNTVPSYLNYLELIRAPGQGGINFVCRTGPAGETWTPAVVSTSGKLRIRFNHDITPTCTFWYQDDSDPGVWQWNGNTNGKTIVASSQSGGSRAYLQFGDSHGSGDFKCNFDNFQVNDADCIICAESISSSSSSSSSSVSSSSSSLSSSSSSNAVADWQHSITGWVESSRFASDLSEFPVPIEISKTAGINSDDLAHFFQHLGSDANRKKIAFVDASDHQLYAEIESFDRANRKAFFHVKFPSASSSTDTPFYIYYDNTKLDNTTYIGDIGDVAAQNVWDSDFMYVCHFNTLNGKDSTVQGTTADSTAIGTTTVVDGVFGKALSFNGDGYLTYKHSSFDPNDSLTTDQTGIKWDHTAHGSFQEDRNNAYHIPILSKEIDVQTWDASGMTMSRTESNNKATGYLSHFLLVGDFDIRVTIEETYESGFYTYSGLAIKSALSEMSNLGSYDVWLYRRRTDDRIYVNYLATTSNSGNYIGVSIKPITYRITRVGTSIYCYYWNGSDWTGLDSHSDSNSRWIAPMWVMIGWMQGTNNHRNTVIYSDFEVVSADDILYMAPESLRMRNQYHNSYRAGTIELYHKADSHVKSTIVGKQISEMAGITQEFSFNWDGSNFKATWYKEEGASSIRDAIDLSPPAVGDWKYYALRNSPSTDPFGYLSIDYTTRELTVGWATGDVSSEIRSADCPLIIGANLEVDTGLPVYSDLFSGDVGELRISNTDRGTSWIAATEYGLEDDLIYYSDFEGSSSSSVSSSSVSSSSSSISSSSISSSSLSSSSSYSVSCYVSANDDFTGTNESLPNVHRWVREITDTVDSPAREYDQIYNNQFDYDTNGNANPIHVTTYTANFIMVGDFQIEILVPFVNAGFQSASGQTFFPRFGVADATSDEWIAWLGNNYDGNFSVKRWGSLDSGESTTIGTSNSGFRVRRISNVIDVSWKRDNGSWGGWVSVGDETGNMKARFEFYQGRSIGGDTDVRLDDFTATYDDIICAGSSSSSSYSSSSSTSSSSSSSAYCLNFSSNRARGGTATASSNLPGLNPYEAFDGVIAYWNTWAAEGIDQTAWIQYDFGEDVDRQIEKVRIYGQQQNYPDRVIVSGSNDSEWNELTDQNLNWPVPTAYQYAEIGFFNVSAWRYIRLTFPDQPWVRATEIELYECSDTTSSSSSLSSSSSSFSSSSSSSVSSSSVSASAAAGCWTEVMGPEYWIQTEGTWDGSKYLSENIGGGTARLHFFATGYTWPEDYAQPSLPSKMRITFANVTANPILQIVLKKHWTTVVDETDVDVTNPIVVFDIADDYHYVEELHIIEGGDNPYEVTNIEFFGDCDSSSSSSNSSSSSISSSSSSLSSSSSESSSTSSSSSSISASSSSSSESAGLYAYFGYNTLSPYPGDHYEITLDDDSRVSGNYNQATLQVKRNINYIKTGLINFDLKWMADSTADIVNVYLHLKTTSTTPSGIPISVHAVKKPWTPSVVNWIDRASKWSIVARGALDTEVDTNPIPTDTVTPTEASTWYRWDIRDIVLDIIANQDLTNNNGFILRYPREGGTAVFGETVFYGNDSMSDDDKPYIVLALKEFQLLSSSSSVSSSSSNSSSSSSYSYNPNCTDNFDSTGSIDTAFWIGNVESYIGDGNYGVMKLRYDPPSWQVQGDIQTRFAFTSDFDVRLDFEIENINNDSGSTTGGWFNLFTTDGWSYMGVLSGDQQAGIPGEVFNGTQYFAGGGQPEIDYIYVNSGAAAGSLIGSLRITRYAGVIRAYYWKDGIWQFDGSPSGYVIETEMNDDTDIYVETMISSPDGKDYTPIYKLDRFHTFDGCDNSYLWASSSSVSSSSSSSSISSSSSSTSSSSAAPVGYVETKGTTNWITTTGTWDGSEYTAEANGDWKVILTASGEGAIGNWFPIKARITLYNESVGYDPQIDNIKIFDTSDNLIADSQGPITLDNDGLPATTIEVDILYYPSYDLDYIQISSALNKFYVTSVELFADYGTAHRITIFSESGDGAVFNSANDTWANVHDAVTGDEISAEATIHENAATAWDYGSGYLIGRSHFIFDISSLTITASSIQSILVGIVAASREEGNVTIQESTFTSPVSLADFDAFTGSQFVDRPLDWIIWINSQYHRNTFTLNSAGRTYVENLIGSGSVKLCMREYDHDYLDVDPSGGSYRNGASYNEIEETGLPIRLRTPRIVITYLKDPVWLDNIGSSYWTIDNDATWDGSKYTSDSETIELSTTGSWAVDYKPYKIRFEFTGTSELYVQMYNTEGSSDLLFNNNVFTNGEEKVIWNYNNYDIDVIQIYNNDSGEFDVTKIEFLDTYVSSSSSSSSLSLSSSSLSSSSLSLIPIEDLVNDYSLFQTGPAYLSTNNWPEISRCTWSGLPKNAESVCYGNKAGSPFVGDFNIDFIWTMSGHTNIANSDTLMLCCVCDSPGTFTEQVVLGDGIMIVIRSGPSQELMMKLYCANNTNENEVALSGTANPTGTMYARLTRVGTTATAYAYSDLERTVLVGSTSITVPTTSFGYFVPVASIESVSGSYFSSGYAQNFQITP